MITKKTQTFDLGFFDSLINREIDFQLPRSATQNNFSIALSDSVSIKQ